MSKTSTTTSPPHEGEPAGTDGEGKPEDRIDTAQSSGHYFLIRRPDLGRQESHPRNTMNNDSILVPK